MTRIAERQLRRLRRVRAGKFRSDSTAGEPAFPVLGVRTKLDAFDALDAHR
jgi:hypothetical protein